GMAGLVLWRPRLLGLSRPPACSSGRFPSQAWKATGQPHFLLGYNRVGYSLQAVGGAVAEGSGVLPRLAGSTATGVSIRVTDEAGVPLRMGLSLPVTAYDKNTAGRTGSR
ncbi:hypothetical protein, partial [Salmonella sp. SAL04281]|uniref:hypothetical protein n=1 Tax=Salmonella sp. SAL04281 TaxID=3159859 RepID=UPI00397831BF